MEQVKEKLMDAMHIDVETIASENASEDERKAAVLQLQKEMELYNSIEKHRVDVDTQKRKVELEADKIMNEKIEAANEIARIENEDNAAKKNRVWNVVLKSLEIGAPIVTSVLFLWVTLLGYKFEYGDIGKTPPTIKEVSRFIMKK